MPGASREEVNATHGDDRLTIPSSRRVLSQALLRDCVAEDNAKGSSTRYKPNLCSVQHRASKPRYYGTL